MNKFQLSYLMEVQDKFGNYHEISFPLTCDIDIERNTLAGFNTAEFTVFNLSDNTRNLLARNAISFSDTRSIKFYAGYGDNLPLIFSGFVQNCVSNRDSVDWMTTFSCFDPGPLAMNKNISPPPFNAGSFLKNNVQNIIETYMKPITVGKIGTLFDENPTLLRANSYSGSVTSILRKISNGNFYIDNSQAFLLAPNETLPDSGFKKIDASTGLLGSPSYEQTFITANILFEPTIVMSQLLELDCDQKYLNGNYKVVALGHKGRISGAAGGDMVSSVVMGNPLNSQGNKVFA